MEVDRFHELNAFRIAASGTFGRLHVLPLIPDLLSLNPGLQVDLILSDFVRDMVRWD
jgi:DNA-binding transcriptional LysR family regulator